MKKRTLALLCAVTMVIGIAVGGSLAWLVSKPDSVTNTFTTSDVDITLTEPEGEKNDYEFQMVPGKPITKDPKVTVIAGSLDSYIFVEITKSDNYDDFLDGYTVANGWTAVGDSAPGVYYRQYTSSDVAVDYQILANNQVTVKSSVTKTMMENLTKETYPTLTFTAYAIQKDYLKDSSGTALTEDDIVDIWDLAKTETTPSTP